MSDCTGCGTSNSPHTLRPNLACPPDMSTLMFRFVDSKSVGIVKGPKELFLLNMSRFFLPIQNYSMQNICLDGSAVEMISGGGVKDKGERREIVEFNTDDSTIPYSYDTVFEFFLFNDKNEQIGETLKGDASNFSELIENLKQAILDDSDIRSKIEYLSDNGDSLFSLRAKDKGKTYTYGLVISDEYGYDEPIINPIVTQSHLRYPQGAYKLMLFNNVFCESCTDSNKQLIEYAYDSDVQENGIENANWRTMGPLGVFTGAEDVVETDTNKIETIWVKNPGDCEVNIDVIVAI